MSAIGSCLSAPSDLPSLSEYEGNGVISENSPTIRVLVMQHKPSAEMSGMKGRTILKVVTALLTLPRLIRTSLYHRKTHARSTPHAG
jgi:hypothetical protein